MEQKTILKYIFICSLGTVSTTVFGINPMFQFNTDNNKSSWTPKILYPEGWLSADSCQTLSSDHYLCRFPKGLELDVKLDKSDKGLILNPQIKSNAHATFKGLSIEANIQFSSETAFLSHGFQSWSNSGWLPVGKTMSEAELEEKLKKDDEHRDGRGLSRSITLVSDQLGSIFLAGALSESLFKNWIVVGQSHNKNVFLKIGSGGAGESKALRPGSRLDLDPWYIEQGDRAQEALVGYARRIRSYPKKSEPRVGWNSWYDLWSKVDEEAIRKHITLIPKFLQKQFDDQGLPAPSSTLVIDDGWEVMWGEWQSSEKFPDIQKLAKDIRTSGLEPGIWLAPFLVSNTSEAFSDPKFFVRGVKYLHSTGSYRIIDVTYPPAAAHLDQVVRSLVNKGFTTLKIDFLVAGSVEGTRHEDVSGMEAYARGLEIIRNAAGEKTYLIACGAPMLASIPYVDSIRTGADIAFEVPGGLIGPSFTDIVNQARNLSARWFFCESTHCDADPMLLRDPHTLQTALVGGWVVALAGGGFHLSDNLSLIEDKVKDIILPKELLTHATSGTYARPDPIVPFGNMNTAFQTPDTADRWFNKNMIKSPEIWTFKNGHRIFLNFSDKEKTYLDKLIPARSSLMLESDLLDQKNPEDPL